jgi:predicted RNA-binding Zn ribbon-like protein
MAYLPELIGGHVALDLLNTVSWRLDPARTIDRMATPEAWAQWCSAVGLVGAPAERERAAVVREVVYGVVLTIARGNGPGDLRELQKFLVAALRRAKPTGLRPLDWVAADAVDELVLAVGRLMEREDLSKLRECQDHGCGWLFLDRSKNASRRWCSSGDCGNRARAKRHYQRARAGQEA